MALYRPEPDRYDDLKSFGYSDDAIQFIKLVDKQIEETEQRIEAGNVVLKQCKEQRSVLQDKLREFNKLREQIIRWDEENRKPKGV